MGGTQPSMRAGHGMPCPYETIAGRAALRQETSPGVVRRGGLRPYKTSTDKARRYATCGSATTTGTLSRGVGMAANTIATIPTAASTASSSNDFT
jgi:hypothetical protein